MAILSSMEYEFLEPKNIKRISAFGNFLEWTFDL
jgi:hypothetical protein